MLAGIAATEQVQDEESVFVTKVELECVLRCKFLFTTTDQAQGDEQSDALMALVNDETRISAVGHRSAASARVFVAQTLFGW